MDHFLQGLAAERAKLDACAKQAASLKTPAAYQSCVAQLSTTPEYMKISQRAADAMDKNLPADSLMKVLASVGTEREAIQSKHCGPDPEKFAAGRNAALDAAEDAGAKAAGMSLDCYRANKEFIPAYCGMSKDQQQKAMASGTYVPGVGGSTGQLTADEAKALSARCDKLVPAIAAVGG